MEVGLNKRKATNDHDIWFTIEVILTIGSLGFVVSRSTPQPTSSSRLSWNISCHTDGTSGILLNDSSNQSWAEGADAAKKLSIRSKTGTSCVGTRKRSCETSDKLTRELRCASAFTVGLVDFWRGVNMVALHLKIASGKHALLRKELFSQAHHVGFGGSHEGIEIARCTNGVSSKGCKSLSHIRSRRIP